MKTISMFNLKGGCAKTTSVINLGHLLSEKLKGTGEKVLYIDCDMQGNLSNSLMSEDYDISYPGIYHLLTGDKNIREVIYPVRENIDLIPSSLLMATVEPRLTALDNREFVLKQALSQVGDDYAYCLIDCSPSFSTVTTNAVVAADAIFIPVQTEFYAVDGVHLLEETLSFVNQSIGTQKEITLIFATLHDVRNSINKLQYDQLKENFGEKFLDAAIRKNVSLVESPIFKESIFEYKPRSRGARDYTQLFNEIESKGGF